MTFRQIKLSDLIVNRANDRHGELENETAAIAWLFNNREQHMKSLARDIAESGELYESPLVLPVEHEKFVVFDGNRRVTCLKVLAEPKKAPNVELQDFFHNLKKETGFSVPEKITCQIEIDRDRIDEILYRRHTGSQGGVGQSTWDDRMKANFVSRTGKGSGFNVADEIESRLKDSELLPKKQIPRSTLTRLLSSEAFRNRVGFSFSRGKLEYTHTKGVVLTALARIADDLAQRKIVLGDIWDVDGKHGYLDTLQEADILPKPSDRIKKMVPEPLAPPPPLKPPKPAPKPTKRETLIPQVDYGLAWPGRLQRHRAIWEELQFHLTLTDHPNAISVLLRVLLELSIDNYVEHAKVAIGANDKLAVRARKVAEHLEARGQIDKKYLGEIIKLQNSERVVSADTLNRYIHSPDFAPSPEHLMALWDELANLIVECLKQ